MISLDTEPKGPPSECRILQLMSKSLNFTIYDTRWIPGSARIVVLGAHPTGSGALHILEPEGIELKETHAVEVAKPLKCGTFGASDPTTRELATGGFDGRLQLWDMENPEAAVTNIPAHTNHINAIDGAGCKGGGPPELATAGKDGAVRVWDMRQRDAPVAAFLPAASDKARDCWAVAFGDSHNESERALIAGYDNGDVKMFDLRTNTVRWQDNVGNGVCGLAFDRQTIPMNKFIATTLESQFHVFDARTLHPKQGFAKVTTALGKGATAWGCSPLPQNRDLFMIRAGSGSMALYKYNYPDRRFDKAEDGSKVGMPGTTTLIAEAAYTEQPVTGFDWNPDKEGLFCCGAFDQCVRVGTATKLNRF